MPLRWGQWRMKNERGEDERKTANKEERVEVQWQKGFDHCPSVRAEGCRQAMRGAVLPHSDWESSTAAVTTPGALCLMPKPSRTLPCLLKERWMELQEAVLLPGKDLTWACLEQQMLSRSSCFSLLQSINSSHRVKPAFKSFLLVE